MADESKSQDTEGRDRKWIHVFKYLMGFGIFAIILLSLGNNGWLIVTATAGGLLLAAASAAVGGFLGFLFGIPRSKQLAVDNSNTNNGSDRQYLENTNLEQISDWITKIIVGLTLVQYDKIENTIAIFGEKFGPVIMTYADANAQQAVAVSIIVFYLILSFIFGYLWTRIYMETVLRWQNVKLEAGLDSYLEERQQKVGDADAVAMELVDSYLDEKSDASDKKFEDIQDKIRNASVIARSIIFDKARKKRKQSWKGDNRRPLLVDRTIPIFRGLIAAAPNKYHRNYGQLGYAIVKSSTPDWNAASEALRMAIELRGDTTPSGKGYYEFCLATALINLNPEFKSNVKSDAASFAEIKALLDIGKTRVEINDELSVKKWCEINEYI